VLLAAMTASACVYQLDIQQGNLLEQDEIEAVSVGMTRSQVRFLLGTPVVEDSFHQDRWDYVYYFRQGRNKPERRWVIVYFDADKVARILPDQLLDPV
jgi:outer membrane protein assembly factor BamE